jgi:carbon storage regulator
MLVLTRRPHESFRIGHDVVITVLEVSGDKIRIGIEAPAHVEVHRQEVYDEVQRANREAASSSVSAVAELARGAIRPAAARPAPTGSEPARPQPARPQPPKPQAAEPRAAGPHPTEATQPPQE